MAHEIHRTHYDNLKSQNKIANFILQLEKARINNEKIIEKRINDPIPCVVSCGNCCICKKQLDNGDDIAYGIGYYFTGMRHSPKRTLYFCKNCYTKDNLYKIVNQHNIYLSVW